MLIICQQFSVFLFRRVRGRSYSVHGREERRTASGLLGGDENGEVALRLGLWKFSWLHDHVDDRKWSIACHSHDPPFKLLIKRCHRSDLPDQRFNWDAFPGSSSGPHIGHSTQQSGFQNTGVNFLKSLSTSQFSKHRRLEPSFSAESASPARPAW